MEVKNINAFEKRMLKTYNPCYVFESYRRELNGEDKEPKKYRYTKLSVKTAVKERDGGCCVRCGSKEGLQLHHINHYSKGGLDEPDNLITLCHECHIKEHQNEHVYNLMRSRTRNYTQQNAYLLEPY